MTTDPDAPPARVLHFTHTGPFAGQPYCDRPHTPDDDYQHPAYDAPTYALQLARLCPDCRAIENGADR